MSQITFFGKITPGEKKWFGLTWNDELAGEPPAIPPSTVQDAVWTVIEGTDPLIVKINQAKTDYATAVQVQAPDGCAVGAYILEVVMTSDLGEIHKRRVEIEVEIH